MSLAGVLGLVLLVGPVFADDAGESVRFRGRKAAHLEQFRPSGAGRVLLDTLDSDPPAEPYDTVLIQGWMPDARVRIEVAFAASGRGGLKWEPAELRRFSNGRFWARCKFAIKSRAPLRLRVVDSGIKAAHVFELYDVELFVAGTGPDAGAGKETGQPTTRQSAIPSHPNYEFVARESWGARRIEGAYAEHMPVKLTMHHTAGRMPAAYDEAAAEMRFIQDYHINGRGWLDIGYHFVISPTGHVFEGRPEGVLGAHVLHNNTGNLGVSFMGDFQASVSNEPARSGLDAFAALARRLSRDYNIPPAGIKAHRDFNPATDCPGDLLYAQLAELRLRIFGATAPPRAAVGLLVKKDFPAQSYLKSLPW